MTHSSHAYEEGLERRLRQKNPKLTGVPYFASATLSAYRTASEMEVRGSLTRLTVTFTMSPQEEYLDRFIGITFRVQILDFELEVFPVSRTRVQQTESIWQLKLND